MKMGFADYRVTFPLAKDLPRKRGQCYMPDGRLLSGTFFKVRDQLM